MKLNSILGLFKPKRQYVVRYEVIGKTVFRNIRVGRNRFISDITNYQLK
jgi:hypothetical protein